ncbi:alpha/beta fold hydrolase [Niveibacterium terrae]|uniref:alpha/beta fold hydrolase n=1 Tax=Niveibacterium terrae TaxID=3373598 RepID=UPI003A92C399
MSTWILLRGLSREARHWSSFPGLLGERLGEPVLCPDLPGFGTRAGQRSPARIEAIVDEVRASLASHPPPYHLLAMSLGAMIGICWAATHPEELTSCVLINTSLRPFNPFWQRLRPANYAALIRLALPGASELAAEKTVLATTSNLIRAPEALLADWLAIRRSAPPRRSDTLRQLVAAIRYRAPRTAPQVPLLVLASAADRLVSPRCSQTLAERWGADYREHPTAGHDLPLDDGEWTVQAISDWRSVRQNP